MFVFIYSTLFGPQGAFFIAKYKQLLHITRFLRRYLCIEDTCVYFYPNTLRRWSFSCLYLWVYVWWEKNPCLVICKHNPVLIKFLTSKVTSLYLSNTAFVSALDYSWALLLPCNSFSMLKWWFICKLSNCQKSLSTLFLFSGNQCILCKFSRYCLCV